ncbi:hypothetical protein BUALT_Bualt10G0069200 [Buddleja alternifolia]|uniref:Uncharacterized protein n=1 Tax=Buddleja alternifolia TaxID=168488 RepID=A0AAV6WY44_9LAMI|nr:hypothetical protein BUALT_Bualt10G0069200 [Buddleja alternifolia]
MCPTEPFLISREKDMYVVLWSIHEQISSSVKMAHNVDIHYVDGWSSQAKFIEEARSPFIRKNKIILNPDEVNLIMELSHNCNIEYTHIESPGVFIWDVETQLNHHSIVGCKTAHVPTVKVKMAHKADIHYFDWISNDVHLILTGSANNTIHMYFQGSWIPVVDFQWNVEDLWTIVSVSNDAAKLGGEGTL